MKQRAAGITGLASAALFTTAVVISALTFEGGAYSLLNCFVTELGAYTGGYMSASPAGAFNLGAILSGLLFIVFMVLHGIQKAGALFTASSFFGVACGVFLAAQGVITLNYPSFHLAFSAAFFISSLLMCAFLIAAEARQSKSASTIFLSSLAGAASAVCAAHILQGGVLSVLAEDVWAARVPFMPFAALQWAAYALLFTLVSLIAAKTLRDRR